MEYTMSMLGALREMAARDEDQFVAYGLDMIILHIHDALSDKSSEMLDPREVD